MRVIFDLQALQNGSRSRGIGRYVLHLFEALARDPKVEVFGLLNAGLSDHFDEARQTVIDTVGEHRLLVFSGLSPTREIDEENLSGRLASEAAYVQFLDSLQFDALLVGTLFEGFMDETVVSLEGAGYRKFVVLYDLIPLLDQKQYLDWDKLHRWYHAKLEQLTKADALLAISESARKEAIEHLGRKPSEVVTIGTATDPDIFHDKIKRNPAILQRLGVDRPFVMHTSAFEERKNFAGLIRAFANMPAELRRGHQLVLAGKANDEAKANLRDVAHSVGLTSDDMIFTGYVEDEELAQLYRYCDLFVFPSFHEGFGLPALEAMSCGCPTIGSNRSSIPEVIGRTDLLFDPTDSDEMAGLMAKLLSSKKDKQSAASHAVVQSRKFSWKRVAAHATEAFARNEAPAHIPSLSLEQAVRQVRKRVPEPLIGPTQDQDLARSLARNEQQAFAQIGRLAAQQKQSWRIEGPFDSSYSLALLNRETARALEELGYRVSLHSTEGPGDFDPDPAFLATNRDLAEFHRRSTKEKAKPDLTSRLLYPPRVDDMEGRVKALHHYAWEESGFPQDWALSFNANLTMMTCLSRHVEKIMIDNGVTVPMLTSGCGVDHWDRIEADRRYRADGKKFRFLHVSSCFPRKGADLLLAAYGAAFTSDDPVSLVIKTFDNPHNEVAEQLKILRRDNAKFPHVNLIVADLSDPELKALYEQCDVMVGPSCAEGYGLPFAEAMLSGLPVITTNWGGQLDFCNEGNSWLVDFDFERARTHFGLWSSVWARAKPGELANAMRRASRTPAEERREMADRGRRQLLATHKWSDVALRLSAASALLPAIQITKPKVGWMTTWGSKCGIATYSAHLLDKLYLETFVYAPKNEDHLADGPSVVRSWTLGKETSGYDEVHAHCREHGVGVLVVQFNYNFYDHRGLARLVAKCRGDGIRLVVFLHSTVDPPEPKENLFHLRHMKNALAACDRILVHSVADLNRLKALGLIDNVTLFPHGILEFDSPRVDRTEKTDTIASYGFALPNKGLEELVEAVAILHGEGRKVRLRLINAEYPVDVSRNIIEDLREQIDRLGLSKYVEHHHEFLSDEESLGLLQGCDLAVFPYQHTGESASGAARYGMSADIPVAVTPVSIFDDLGQAVFRFGGTSPAQLAAGIGQFLDGLRRPSLEVVAVSEAARSWRAQHSYTSVAGRLSNIFVALANLPGSAVYEKAGKADGRAVAPKVAARASLRVD